jgi:carboxyl-terminal processing protease
MQRQADNSWDYWLDREHKIAHIRLSSLGTLTADDLRDALVDLKSQGMRGLVLDLRWCPGGMLRTAVDVTGLFLAPQALVATARVRNQSDVAYQSEAGVKFMDVPLVVLVNGDSSGGAELIAAALQDNHRALVAGQRTLGKGSIQGPILLPVPDAGLKLTTGTLVRASGKNLHRFPESRPTDDWGVLPDEHLEFRVSSEMSKQLKEWWLQQTLRPGSSNQLLPLDDPERDPQRQEALRALMVRMK